jgi:hypothetical protein
MRCTDSDASERQRLKATWFKAEPDGWFGFEDGPDPRFPANPRAAHGKDGKKAAQRILYASDAPCLSKAEFRPHSRFKTDDARRDRIDTAATAAK